MMMISIAFSQVACYFSLQTGVLFLSIYLLMYSSVACSHRELPPRKWPQQKSLQLSLFQLSLLTLSSLHTPLSLIIFLSVPSLEYMPLTPGLSTSLEDTSFFVNYLTPIFTTHPNHYSQHQSSSTFTSFQTKFHIWMQHSFHHCLPSSLQHFCSYTINTWGNTYLHPSICFPNILPFYIPCPPSTSILIQVNNAFTPFSSFIKWPQCFHSLQLHPPALFSRNQISSLLSPFLLFSQE